MSLELNLQAIKPDNFQKVIKLELDEGEAKFVAKNDYSIAQAYVEPNTTPKAICLGNEPVGFVYYGQFEEDKGEYWVARLMTDKGHRKKGYGKKGMQLVIEELKESTNCDKLFVSFVPGNDIAEALYIKLGFLDTKRIEGNEKVYCLSFN